MDVGEDEMIPESIKIDDDGDFEISYTDSDYQECILYFTFEEIEEAYLFSKSKRENKNTPIKYGCHVNVIQGDDVIDNCVFDDDTITECTFACDLEEQGKGKFSCQYWRAVEVKK